MEILTLKAQRRDEHGKGAARRNRQSGEMPAVIYGRQAEPTHVTLTLRDFEQFVHAKGTEHAVLNLDVEGAPDLSGAVLIKDVQHHPIKSYAVHVDFLRIDLNEKIHTSVQLTLTGRPVGVIEGGIMEQEMHEIEIECLAAVVPDALVHNVSSLKLGQSLHVRDYTPPEGITVLSDPEKTLVAIHPPKLAAAAAEAEPEAQAAE